MNTANIPPQLQTLIDAEPTDFIIEAQRSAPWSESLKLISFGLMTMVIASITALEIFWQIKNPATPLFTSSLIMPLVIMSAFGITSIILLTKGITSTAQGGYFAATPTRLIQVNKKKIRSVDWEQFTGNTNITGTVRNGTLTLEMRTGHMVRKNRQERYVPDMLHIVGIPNVFKIAKICRRRIKENDPTLTKTL